jgi:hypothetical protein
MRAGPCSDRATWACGVRRVVLECGTVLLVAVRTAVTRWQPGALRDDQGGSPLDPQECATLASGPRSAPRPGPVLCCWCRAVVCVVVSSPPGYWPCSPVYPLCPGEAPRHDGRVTDDLVHWGSCGSPRGGRRDATPCPHPPQSRPRWWSAILEICPPGEGAFGVVLVLALRLLM